MPEMREWGVTMKVFRSVCKIIDWYLKLTFFVCVQVVVNKKPGETLGMMILESGWGSMIPTAIVAHLAKDGPVTKSGRLNVGDQILEVDGTSLVGLTLAECQTHIKVSWSESESALFLISGQPGTTDEYYTIIIVHEVRTCIC